MKFKEYNQRQIWLIPPDLEDEIPKGDLCRVIDEVVENIDIKCIEDKYPEEGNTAYHPRMMLKILFYSYARGIFSSRKIAQELERNIFYWYLSGKQKPNFRTICLFRSAHREELKIVFQEIVKLCLNLGLTEISTVTIDGTKIKANAAKGKTRDKDWIEKKIAEESMALEKALEEAERIDAEEDEKYGRDKRGDEIPEEIRDRKKRLEKLAELKKRMEAEKCRHINETDSDARLMKGQGQYLLGYNCQAVVDAKSQVILAANITNEAREWHQLKENINELRIAYGVKPKVLLGDAGYCSGENLRYLKEENIFGIIPDKPIAKIKAEIDNRIFEDQEFKKERFKYDQDKDVYICPEGKELQRVGDVPTTLVRKSGEIVRSFQYQCHECSNCKVRSRCCGGKRDRCITRYSDEVLREEMADRIRSKEGYELYKQRFKTAEPVFGNIKQNIGFREFNLRGMFKTRAEFILVAIAHNLMKIQSWLRETKIKMTEPKLAYLRA